MSHDHLVRKKALLDYKKWILQSCHIGIFSKGSTHDFGQKLNFLFVCFWTKRTLKSCLMII